MKNSLGIDLGTTKVAVVMLDTDSGKLLGAASRETRAAIDSDCLRAGQSVPHIMEALGDCLRALPADRKEQVQTIGVTGQMHGVLLWNSSSGNTSSLITWQDRRCEPRFLAELGKKTGDFSLKSGFGCATLAWLAKNALSTMSEYDCAATIHDYLVHRMCGLARPVTDPTDAASWGFYDARRQNWDFERARKAGIAKHFLPEIRVSGSPAGTLSAALAKTWGLRGGIPVCTALGDNQASLYATLKDPEFDAGLTLGTGGQLAVIIDSLPPEDAPVPVSFEVRPYIDNKFAAVAASLCGGSALVWLPAVIENWCRELKLTPPSREKLFERIIELGLKSGQSSLAVTPNFMGERHDMQLRASIKGIDMDNFTLGNLGRSLGKGILMNLKQMLPAELIENRKRLVVSGNAMRKSPLMQALAQEVFGLPLVLNEAEEEAAQGAALLAGRLI